MFRIAFTAGLLLASCAASFAQAKPDLTITGTLWRDKPRSVLVVVANVGTAKAPKTMGGYKCQTEPNAQGYSVGSGVQFFIPELLPNQKTKIFLKCNAGWKITGAGVDSGNKIDESNESNNTLNFATEVQQKTNGPIQKKKPAP